MRVAFDGRAIGDHYPGLGRYAFGIVKALAAFADVVLFTHPDETNTRYELSRIAAPLLPLKIGPGSLNQYRFISPAVAAAGAHIYHAPYYRLYPSPAIAPLPCPGVATFYDLIPLSAEGFSIADRWMIRFLHQMVGRNAARIIVLSRAARDSFVSKLKLDPAKFVVIPPGVDSSFGPRSPANVTELRRRLGLPEDYFLFVGTNKPHKNLPRLIEAIAQLPTDSPPLVIAGNEDRRFPQARRAVERLGLKNRVHFLGPVAEADLPALYSGATLFVFPSLEEGFGLPVIEAMACGTRVACSTAPGLDEAAGEAAVRFDPQAPDQMAETMLQLLQNRDWRLEIGRRGLAHAAEFTWERAARETVKVYEAALGTH